jgi:broad specificity phosphatase PhoE
MADPTGPKLYLLRHAETEWSRAGRHTGRTDVPLTEHGREVAREIGRHLHRDFALVLCSPLSRSHETARLAGFENEQVREDLLEWDYGDYEGLTTQQIREQRPDWWLWRDGCPNGEQPADVAVRCDRVIDEALGAGGDVALVAHGHVLRVLAARWVGEEAAFGARLHLHTGAVCVLGMERETRVLLLWNATPAAARAPGDVLPA